MLSYLLFSKDGHNMFSWFFNMKALDHLLYAELILPFINNCFAFCYLQLLVDKAVLQKRAKKVVLKVNINLHKC